VTLEAIVFEQTHFLPIEPLAPLRSRVMFLLIYRARMSTSDDKFVKIGIRDDDGDVETPWAVALGGNLYRLDNTPFFAYQPFGRRRDRSIIAEADGFLFFTRSFASRAIAPCAWCYLSLPTSSGADTPAEIKRLGCTTEGGTTNSLHRRAPAVSLDSVAERLAETGLEWEYADRNTKTCSRRQRSDRGVVH
jgi:hypothetical protein